MSIEWTTVSGVYGDVLYNTLLKLEAPKASDRLNGLLVEGNFTIGIGFDLVAGGAQVQSAVFSKMGIKATPPLGARPGVAGVAQTEYDYAKALIDAISAHKGSAELNAIMANRSATANANPAYASYLGAIPRNTFGFANEAEVRQTFDFLWVSVYRQAIFNKWPELSGDVGFSSSKELIALASIVWNGGTGLLGPKLRAAVQNGNRAEAWYEIRYGSNGGLSAASAGNGIAKRRYVEAQLFGLYDNANQVSVQNAQQILEMLTKHRNSIVDYEANYGRPPDGTSAKFDTISLANNDVNLASIAQVQSLIDVLSPARAAFISWLNSQISSESITLVSSDWNPAAIFFTSPDLPTPLDASNLDGKGNGMDKNIMAGGDGLINDEFKGGKGADFLFGNQGDDDLFGGDGADTLLGGEGDDNLIGGGGDDQLKGGVGRDFYIFIGDYGSDVIQDSDNQGAIGIGGYFALGGSKKSGSSYYEDSGGTVYQWFGNTLTIARKGKSGQVTVKDWSNGKLSIRLVEEGATKGPPPDISSPIVLDLDGDGIETVGLGAQVHFDHDGDGFAELTGWAGPDDGLLVRDLNGNGQIDSGAELFGANTVRPGNSLAANGFVALSDLDVNGDQSISGSELATLSVWRDTNQNGQVDEGELRSAVDSGIASISTGYTNSSITDGSGNQHRQIGSYVSVDGSTLSAVDVWFAANRADSIATPLAQELPADVLALPDIEGYGTVRSLHESMALDPVLKSLVGQFVQQQDAASRLLLMRDILWQWTGAVAHQANSRGEFIEDARWLYMVERLTGKPFIQAFGINESTSNPGPSAAQEIYASSRTMVEVFYGRLMAATHLQSLYSAIIPTWDVLTDSFLVDYSEVIGLVTASINQDRVAGTILLADFMRSMKGQWLATPEAIDQLDSGLASLGSDIQAIVRSSHIATGLGLDAVGVGDDVMTGTAQADILFGGDGHDMLLGLSGNDELIGGSGNDVLNGGTGNDRLYGNNGSDRYCFNLGDGQDTVYNQDPIATANDIDTIQFNFAESKVHARREEGNLVLNITDTSDQITVVGYFDANATTSAAVKRIEFSDGKVWSIDDVKNLVLIPTEQADLLSGFSGNDTVGGLGGSDTIYGGTGQDQLHGGAGDDSLYGGEGADSLMGGAGDDVLDGGAGDDTYIFGLGDGHDVIREGINDYQASGFDTVRIRSGVQAQDIRIVRDRTDLILKLPGQMVGSQYVYDSIRLQHVWDQDGNVPYKIERVHIEDGDVDWSFEDIKQRLLTGAMAMTLSTAMQPPNGCRAARATTRCVASRAMTR